MKISKDMKQEFIRLYRKGLSTVKIAKKFNCSSSAVWENLKRGGCKIRPKLKVDKRLAKKIVQLYKKGLSTVKIERKLKIGDNTALRHLKKFKVKIRKGPKPIKKSSANLTIEKAYVLGVLGPGDGYVYNIKKNDYVIGLQATNKKFVDFFAKCLFRVYGLKIPRRIGIHKKRKNSNPLFVAELHSKLAYKDLMRYNVSFREFLWRVPEVIKNSSEKMQTIYIRGMADSQGSVDIGTKHIELANKNKEGLEEIKEMLIKMGITHCSIRHNRLNITSRKSLDLFYRKIGFLIPYKINALKKLLSSYKISYTPKCEVDKLLPQIVILRKKGLSKEKIANKLKLSYPTISERLNKLGIK